MIEAETREDLLALDEALDGLAKADPQAAQLVQLRYFSGLTAPEVAQVLDISPCSANLLWAYARACCSPYCRARSARHGCHAGRGAETRPSPSRLRDHWAKRPAAVAVAQQGCYRD